MVLKGGGAYLVALLAPHLEGVLIVSGPKLPKTGGISTDDPVDDSIGHFILVYVYIQLCSLWDMYSALCIFNRIGDDFIA